jgi:hypothetical protein
VVMVFTSVECQRGDVAGKLQNSPLHVVVFDVRNE